MSNPTDKKHDFETRTAERYAGLNPLSMVISPILDKTLPKGKKLLGGVVANWHTITEGLPVSQSKPTGIKFNRGKNKATLALEVSSSQAPFIEYETPKIIERVNRYLGRSLIEKITLKHANINAESIAQETKTESLITPSKSKKKLKCGACYSEKLQNGLENLYQTLHYKKRYTHFNDSKES